MVRILSFIGLAAALTVSQAAFAESSTGYGAEGPHHARHGAPLSTFQRNWNNGPRVAEPRAPPRAGCGGTEQAFPLRS